MNLLFVVVAVYVFRKKLLPLLKEHAQNGNVKNTSPELQKFFDNIKSMTAVNTRSSVSNTPAEAANDFDFLRSEREINPLVKDSGYNTWKIILIMIHIAAITAFFSYFQLSSLTDNNTDETLDYSQTEQQSDNFQQPLYKEETSGLGSNVDSEQTLQDSGTGIQTTTEDDAELQGTGLQGQFNDVQ